MDSMGGFHLEENDGKLFQLVYHHPKYNPIPQTQTSTPSVEPAGHDHPHKPLFLCPIRRCTKSYKPFAFKPFPFRSSPEYVLATTGFQQDKTSTNFYMDHPVLPLFWCDNKEFDVDGGCGICGGLDFGTDYYFCESHDKMFHKECVESPLKIKHPSHPEHFVQLYFNLPEFDLNIECLWCGRIAEYLVYYCNICKVVMHPICAMKTIPFVIDQPKRHNHPLTFFPRQASLTCNVCGLLRQRYPTYVCLRCNFVAHKDCMYSPSIIKISRHHHRVSYIPSLPYGEWSCGICRQSIDCNYGAYTCEKCSDYVVHSRCALWKDVWDGEELDGLLEEGDITNDAEPLHMISEGLILHFLHDHQLLLKVNILYDENKFCQACALPIFEGNSYSCMKCGFFLHETCANAPRILQHALHPHPLTLRAVSRYDSGGFKCNACDRFCGGFVYECRIGKCDFDLDLRCALISEPFVYEGHEHPLFLALNPIDKPVCHVCKTECHKQLNCIKCSFIVCMKCATLPSKVRYKHDKHFLTILYEEEVCENNWCEVCERDLGDTDTKVFYGCNECCTTFHIECLFGKDPYYKPGQYYSIRGKEVQIVLKSNLSRPLCDSCKNRCQDKIFKRDYRIACSRKCAFKMW